jgi:hypothetical protein
MCFFLPLVNYSYFVHILVTFIVSDDLYYFRKYFQKSMRYLLKQLPWIKLSLRRHLIIYNFWILKCLTFLFCVRLYGNNSWDSIVGIATGYGQDNEGSPNRVKNFLFSTSSRLVVGPTQPPIQWVLGALSPGVKQQGREADHSPPTSAKVKKMWIYKATPPYAFMI